MVVGDGAAEEKKNRSMIFIQLIVSKIHGLGFLLQVLPETQLEWLVAENLRLQAPQSLLCDLEILLQTGQVLAALDDFSFHSEAVILLGGLVDVQSIAKPLECVDS